MQDFLIPFFQHIKGFHGYWFPKAFVALKHEKESQFAHPVEEAAAHLLGTDTLRPAGGEALPSFPAHGEATQSTLPDPWACLHSSACPAVPPGCRNEWLVLETMLGSQTAHLCGVRVVGNTCGWAVARAGGEFSPALALGLLRAR